MYSKQTILRKSTRKSLAVIPSTETLTTITKRKTLVPNSHDSLVMKKTAMTPKTPLASNQEPKTPACATNTVTPKTRYPDPVMLRIQKDLNSPSAGARVRAQRALKSPNFKAKNYGIFDVPHEQQDLITEEERKSIKPKTIAEIFANCKVYVEVRTDDDNRSAGIKGRLLRDGITVNEKLYKDTSHVVFKDGLLSTYKNAKKLGIPVINILWIDACITQKRLVDTEKFKISNLDRYEHPELYKRIRRRKSYQPEITLTPYVPQPKANPEPPELEATPGSVQEEASGMEWTLQNEKTLEDMALQTPGTSIAQLAPNDKRRMTTFTPKPMEQTGIVAKSLLERRKSLFTPQSSQSSSEADHGFSANSSNTIKFNSANRISKSSRRSIYDISMNILEMNCKGLTSGTEEEWNPVTDKDKVNRYLNITSDAPETPQEITATQQNKPVTVRKRKLFNDTLDEEFDIGKENFEKSLKELDKKVPKKRKSLAANFNTPQPAKKPIVKNDHRRTLSCFKTEKPKDVIAKKKMVPKPAAAQKIIVLTNMSTADKKVICAAIIQLGGIVENEVTKKTTHVVTPNDERTMNVLRGVIWACTIINVDWIHESFAQKKWLDTTLFLRPICDSNRVCERSMLGLNYKNTSLANQGIFYLNKETIDNPKKVDYLREIIALCGGTVTDIIANAQFIISDHPLAYKTPKQSVVISTYIFDSAMKGSCLDVCGYSPKAPKV